MQLEDGGRLAGPRCRAEDGRGGSVQRPGEVLLAGLRQAARVVGHRLSPVPGADQRGDDGGPDPSLAGLVVEALDLEAAGGQHLFPPRLPRTARACPGRRSRPARGPRTSGRSRPWTGDGRSPGCTRSPSCSALGPPGDLDLEPLRDPLAGDVREGPQGRVAIVRDRPVGMIPIERHPGLQQGSGVGRVGGADPVAAIHRGMIEDRPLVDHDRRAAAEHDR